MRTLLLGLRVFVVILPPARIAPSTGRAERVQKKVDTYLYDESTRVNWIGAAATAM